MPVPPVARTGRVVTHPSGRSFLGWPGARPGLRGRDPVPGSARRLGRWRGWSRCGPPAERRAARRTPARGRPGTPRTAARSSWRSPPARCATGPGGPGRCPSPTRSGRPRSCGPRARRIRHGPVREGERLAVIGRSASDAHLDAVGDLEPDGDDPGVMPRRSLLRRPPGRRPPTSRAPAARRTAGAPRGTPRRSTDRRGTR